MGRIHAIRPVAAIMTAATGMTVVTTATKPALTVMAIRKAAATPFAMVTAPIQTIA